MKAIYLNIDPMLAAFAAWLNAGKPGTAPSFNPLPVAVTIPLGESAALLAWYGGDGGNAYSVDGTTVYLNQVDAAGIVSEGEAIGTIDTFSAFSAASPLEVYTIPGDINSFGATFHLGELNGTGTGGAEILFTVPVLVRRETASGPVDLVDFTPTPTAIAAGTDLKGATFGGNEIVAAAGTGALSAPAGA
jgi:hypothetical protein